MITALAFFFATVFSLNELQYHARGLSLLVFSVQEVVSLNFRTDIEMCHVDVYLYYRP